MLLCFQWFLRWGWPWAGRGLSGTLQDMDCWLMKCENCRWIWNNVKGLLKEYLKDFLKEMQAYSQPCIWCWVRDPLTFYTIACVCTCSCCWRPGIPWNYMVFVSGIPKKHLGILWAFWKCQEVFPSSRVAVDVFCSPIPQSSWFHGPLHGIQSDRREPITTHYHPLLCMGRPKFTENNR